MGTSTSAFGAGKREGHDASDFYARFTAPDISTDETVAVQRLCAQLLVLVREEASRIDNAPTHQELAIMINTSRETVTRAFQVLQSQHILLRDGTTLVVQRSDALADIADGKAELTKPKPSEGA